jgi:hypothetical protein
LSCKTIRQFGQAKTSGLQLLQVVRVVVRPPLTGDPAVAQPDIDGLVICEGRDARALLRELEPYPGLKVNVVVQPGLERGAVRKGDDLSIV